MEIELISQRLRICWRVDNFLSLVGSDGGCDGVGVEDADGVGLELLAGVALDAERLVDEIGAVGSLLDRVGRADGSALGDVIGVRGIDLVADQATTDAGAAALLLDVFEQLLLEEPEHALDGGGGALAVEAVRPDERVAQHVQQFDVAHTATALGDPSDDLDVALPT